LTLKCPLKAWVLLAWLQLMGFWEVIDPEGSYLSQVNGTIDRWGLVGGRRSMGACL
jgi:hypothetical protein